MNLDLKLFSSAQIWLATKVVIIVVTAEFLIMQLFETDLFPFIGVSGSTYLKFIDPLLLIAFVAPALYFWLLRPMAMVQTKLEQAIKKSKADQDELFFLVNQIVVGVVQSDLSGHFSFVNERYCEITGYSREELLGMSWQTITHPDDLQFDEEVPREQASKDKFFRIEKRYIRKDGEVIWVSLGSSTRRDIGGRVIGFILVVIDITERKRTRIELQRREREFRTLAENMPDNILRYNREGVTVFVNPVLERTLGDAAAALIGTTVREYHPDGSYEDYAQLLDAVLASGEAREFEKILLAPDGETNIHLIRMIPERGENGEVIGALAIGRDITKLKQAEQHLRELTAHLQTVREEEKVRLAREIHDDLGSTLAALNLRLSHVLEFEFSEEMKKMPLFTRLESMSRILESAIASTRRIITDMRPDVLDNLGLFAALVWQAERFQKHSGIACRVVCAKDLGCTGRKDCEYPVDKMQEINLFRIFQEALSNVARHSGASKVEAEYRPGNGVVVLSICDNGSGLPEGYAPASTSFGIRGMRERVGQLGGQINFGSPLGHGLCVTVHLPLAADNKVTGEFCKAKC